MADVVVTTNQSHKEIAIARGGKRAEDVYVVRSGPQLSRFAVYPPDPVWRQGKSHLLVYLGEICKQDGVDHLIRALKQLIDVHDFQDFHCVLIGGGPHQPVIQRYAQEIGVASHCTFTGRIPDEALCRILSSADIAIDPDPKNDWTDKSTMNKIVEYMFFGLPIVCYDLREARVSAGRRPSTSRPTTRMRLRAAFSIWRAMRRPAPECRPSAWTGCAALWPGTIPCRPFSPPMRRRGPSRWHVAIAPCRGTPAMPG